MQLKFLYFHLVLHIFVTKGYNINSSSFWKTETGKERRYQREKKNEKGEINRCFLSDL